MKKIHLILFSLFFSITANFAQENEIKSQKKQGHIDQNKFRQLKDVLATPNDQHTASGAPGHQYSQQKVDYVMDIRLEEGILGEEAITQRLREWWSANAESVMNTKRTGRRRSE